MCSRWRSPAGLLVIPVGATAASRPIGPLSPASGAWFGGSVNQLNDGVNGGQAEVTARETFLGRRYDIIDRFYGYNAAVPTSLESWDVSMGRIPMITWGAPEDTIRLASGVDDSWLIAQANRFAAFGSPIFLRFFHEMDGDYRRTYVHSAQDFIAAWRHVHDIFVQHGATNVVWIWCPTAWKFTTGSTPQTYYPGDSYVDWIAADGYSWYPVTGGWRTWTQIFQAFYDWASTMNKPIIDRRERGARRPCRAQPEGVVDRQLANRDEDDLPADPGGPVFRHPRQPQRHNPQLARR